MWRGWGKRSGASRGVRSEDEVFANSNPDVRAARQELSELPRKRREKPGARSEEEVFAKSTKLKQTEGRSPGVRSEGGAFAKFKPSCVREGSQNGS